MKDFVYRTNIVISLDGLSAEEENTICHIGYQKTINGIIEHIEIGDTISFVQQYYNWCSKQKQTIALSGNVINIQKHIQTDTHKESLLRSMWTGEYECPNNVVTKVLLVKLDDRTMETLRVLRKSQNKAIELDLAL